VKCFEIAFPEKTLSPESTLCFQQHRDRLSTTCLLIEYYKFALSFILILERQTISCERKRAAVISSMGQVVENNFIAALGDGCWLLMTSCMLDAAVWF
jgi:hypothetical protein